MHAAHDDIVLLTEEIRAATERAVARELHDSVIQPLTTLIVNLEVVRCQSEAATEAPHITTAQIDTWTRLGREAIESLRSALAGLRTHPHARLGLPEALRQYVTPQLQSHGLAVRLEINNWPEELPLDMTTSLYLALREALTNIERHAQASQVRVALRGSRKSLYLLVADNGVGFPQPPSAPQTSHAGHGVGLDGMRERVRALDGRLKITSAPGEGARLEMRIPYLSVESGSQPVDGELRAIADIADAITERLPHGDEASLRGKTLRLMNGRQRIVRDGAHDADNPKE